MLLFNVRKNNQGFTLIEISVALMIIGILSAVAAPSFLSLFKRNEVSDALSKAQGALQEGQREAIRKNKKCTLLIDETNKKMTGGCLVTGERTFNSNIGIKTNETSILFSHKGTITLPDAGTIVFFNQDTPVKKCLVISSPLAIVRTGNYTGQITNPILSANCQQ